MTDPKPYTREQIEAMADWQEGPDAPLMLGDAGDECAAMLRQLLAEADEAKAECEAMLQEVVGLASIEHLDEADRIVLGDKLMNTMGATMVPWFYANGARNLMVVGIINRANGDKFDLILQKAGAKALSEILDELRSQVDDGKCAKSLLAPQADAWNEVFRLCVELGFDPCKAATGLDGVKEFVRGLCSKVARDTADAEADALAARAAEIMAEMLTRRERGMGEEPEALALVASEWLESGGNSAPEGYIAAAVARAKREREGKT